MGIGEEIVSEAGRSTKMQCMECGAKFRKKIGPRTFEVKCPKCGSYDTDVAESREQGGRSLEESLDHMVVSGALYPEDKKANLGFRTVIGVRGGVHLGVFDEVRRKMERNIPEILKPLGGADKSVLMKPEYWSVHPRPDGGVTVAASQELRNRKFGLEDGQEMLRIADRLGWSADVQIEHKVEGKLKRERLTAKR